MKESDRIEAVVDALRAIGVQARATPDGFAVRGMPTRPRGGKVDSGAITGSRCSVRSRASSRGRRRARGAEAAAISFPGFFDLLDSVIQR